MSSSDLELARALSRLLIEGPVGARPASPTAKASASVPPHDPSRFVRFRRSSSADAAAPPTTARSESTVPARATPTPPATPPGLGADVCSPLLESALRAGGAQAAFLLDPDGLVLAAVGSLDSAAAGTLGARLRVALDHARTLSTSGSGETAIAVELEERVLTAFTATAADGPTFTVGFVGPEQVPRPVRDALRRVLAGG